MRLAIAEEEKVACDETDVFDESKNRGTVTTKGLQQRYGLKSIQDFDSYHFVAERAD
jgi:hypothetical protein